MSGAHPARRRSRPLADLSITLKVFVAPCVILLVLLGLAVAAVFVLAADKARLHDISAGALPAYQRAAEAKDAVNATQTALQHMLSVAANESDPKRVRQIAEQVRGAANGAGAAFTHLVASGAASDKIPALRTDLATYQAAVNDVVTAATSDPASATMLMADVDDRFGALSAGLDRYRGAVEAAGQRLAQQAGDAADRARLLLLGMRCSACAVPAADRGGGACHRAAGAATDRHGAGLGRRRSGTIRARSRTSGRDRRHGTRGRGLPPARATGT